jgi:hypothetical protein
MTKDEILSSIEILKGLPNVKSVFTAEIKGQWIPFIGIELRNGDYVKIESLDELYVFAFELGIKDSRKN